MLSGDDGTPGAAIAPPATGDAGFFASRVGAGSAGAMLSGAAGFAVSTMAGFAASTLAAFGAPLPTAGGASVALDGAATAGAGPFGEGEEGGAGLGPAAPVPAAVGIGLADPGAGPDEAEGIGVGAAGGLAAAGRTGAGAVMRFDGAAFSDRIAGLAAGAPDEFGDEVVDGVGAGALDGRTDRESGSVALGTGGAGTADAAGLSGVDSGGNAFWAIANPAKSNGASRAGPARSSAIIRTSDRDTVERKWLRAGRAKPPRSQRASGQPSTMTRTRRLTPSSGFFGSASSVEPLPIAFSLPDGIECFVARKFLTDCARLVDSSLL